MVRIKIIAIFAQIRTKMKKIVLVVLTLVFSATNAQLLQKLQKGNAQMMQVSPAASYKTQADTTLRDHYERCAAPGKMVLYGTTSGGYVSGTLPTIQQSGFNFDFTEQAQFFQYAGSHHVTDVLVWFGAKKGVGLDDDFEIRVYPGRNVIDNASIPPIGTQGFNFGQVTAGSQTNFLSNIFTFATPVAFTDSFLVSIVCKTPISDDTLGIVTSHPDSGCGQNELRFLQKIEEFGLLYAEWNYADKNWQGGFNADLMVLAVVEITTSKGAKNGNLNVFGAFPNPATSQVNIMYELDNPDMATITIYDMSGRMLSEEKVHSIAGLNYYHVDTNQLPNGNYIYSVKTSKGQVASKFCVSK